MRRLALPTALAVAVLLSAGVAHGELTQSGNLRLAFNGRFTPHSLPRDRAAPVTVHLSGSISTTDGNRPPQLRRISIAINRYGRLFARGLPTCRAGLLEQTTTKVALSLCRSALVGRGRFAANVDFPSLAPIPVRGRMLAFNSRAGNRRVILVHIYGSNPVRNTFVLPFKISHRRSGTFGTVLSTRIPKLAADLGYVTDINLKIGRRYRHQGRPRSFLSARCAAPAGFPGAIFALARGTFSFANGQKLTTTLARDCRVR
ncbi:MAG: hypothetical protein FVQ78_10115 [Solirubrobacterales bacterium]|nr:hypothetical protein [Solirubrobacterales bacterium]